jgi:hypothetical protein
MLIRSRSISFADDRNETANEIALVLLAAICHHFKAGSFADLWAKSRTTMRCRVLNDSEHDESGGLAGAQISRNDIDLQRRRHERGARTKGPPPDDFLR